MIELREHSFHYGSLKALDSITLSIKEGEKVAIVGPSGSGKSTLLRELHRLLGAKASFVHQHLALVPQLKAFHNVYMGRLDSYTNPQNLRNLISPEAKRKQEIHAILEQLGIAAKLNSRVSLLSGGEQQRVAIARALYRNAPYLLGDEPVSSVDSTNSENVLQILKSTKSTVVLSMHNIELAQKYCERIIGLRYGEMVFDSESRGLSDRDLLQLYTIC